MTAPRPAAYDRLEQQFRRRSLVGDTIDLLHWDLSVMTPPGGIDARSEQLAALKGICHGIIIDPALADDLAAAEADGGALDDWQSANLREMRRQWQHANAVPADLVEAYSRACCASEVVWRDARKDSDFAMLRPSLERVLDLTKEIGALKAEALGVSLYDALLDQFEPGGRAAAIQPIFDDYAAFLPGFLEEVLSRQSAEPVPLAPMGPFPIAVQQALMRRLAAAAGLDFASARLDESLHPFSAGIPEDSRITTRYDEDDFTQAMMGVLHETGHALYERGRPARWRHQPVGEARGMALHESQSLLIEMQACRSRPFFDWVAPILREAFGARDDDEAWQTEALYRRGIRVERGLIRVDADEVTYPAHVILRYRLERAMLAGDLAVADLPAAWNAEMEALLGVTPPNDRLGCLQDIHWPDGAWGYFPTYTLGAMAAAQLFQAAVAADGGIPDAIGRGDFAPLLAWLRKHVHAKGSLLGTQALLCEATGLPLDPEAFKKHLRNRYLA